MQKTFLIVAASLCLLCQAMYSQDQSNPFDKALKVPFRYLQKVDDKFSHLDNQLSRQTEKYLQKLARQENRLTQKLSKYDAKISQRLNDPKKFYGELINKVNNKINIDKSGPSGEYIPYLDSIRTSLTFLEQNNQLLSQTKDIEEKLNSSLAQVKQFESKLKQTERIKELLRERRAQIKQTLSRYTNLPNRITKEYAGYTKELFYYSAQIKEYKDMVNNPDRITKKALSLLNESNAFRKFSQQYSQLAGLFTLPASYSNMQNLGGLQTRAQVQGLIQTQIAATGPNANQMITQNLQAAQAQLNKFKNKLNVLGKGSGDLDMPDFKPKNLKIKSFWHRLEYGTNIQNTRSNYFLPAQSELGVSIGYKLSEKSSFGVGMNYKVGLGKDIRHLTITGQGIGFRSYIDVKLKGSFFGSGGFEYQRLKPFRELRQLYELDAWQQSALIGISKIVSLKGKWTKKTKLQLLWDMLYTQQTPRMGQPIKFRVGYTF